MQFPVLRRSPLVLLPLVALTWLLLPTPTALADEAAVAGKAFAQTIEKAHHADVWRAHQAIEADITVDFGGQRALEGTMLTTIDGGQVRIELTDGSVLLWDGKTAWTTPVDSAFQGTRFHVLTWPYFLLAPLKLQDPGSFLEVVGDLPLEGKKMAPAARLTFGAGVGDTPDDWYVAYQDPKTQQLAAMAYIVTFGKSVDAAEKEPHAITYGEFTEVDGAVIPLRWGFWNWSEEQGIHGEQLGEVVLRRARFVTPEADAFTPEGKAREEMAPGS